MQPLDGVLDALNVAIDALAVPLECYPSDEVLEFECGLQAVRARFDALCLRGAEAGHLLLPGMAGNHRSVANAVAANSPTDPRQIGSDQRLARWLGEYPLFSEASAGGILTRRHVEALRRAENKRTREHMPQAQEYLIDAAADCSWREFVQVLRYWELAADPDGEEPDEQLVSRFCRIVTNHDGSVSGSFRFDPIAGHAFATAVSQHEQRLLRHDTEIGNERNPAQRRADAVLELILRGATRDDGTIPAPFVHIVFSQQLAETLLNDLADNDPNAQTRWDPTRETGDSENEPKPSPARPADHPTHRERLPIDPRDIDERCELGSGIPINPRWALYTMAAATLRRLVLTTENEATNLSRKVRTFPPHLKLALLAAARGRCKVIGCDAPVPWLEADHAHPWNHRGETDITHNGQILCSHHNKLKKDTIPQKNPTEKDLPDPEPPEKEPPDG